MWEPPLTARPAPWSASLARESDTARNPLGAGAVLPGQHATPTAERTFALDERFLRRHRAGAEVALHLGGSVTLRAEEPRTRRGEPGWTAGTERVAIVEIMGVLAQRAEFGLCGGFIDGYDALAARFLVALADPDVDAVVLRTDSPGGDVAGLEEGVRRMQEGAGTTWKPVLAAVDERAASAAAWVLSTIAKDGIFGPPAARFGSIATAIVYVDESGAEEKAGRKVTIVRGLPGKLRPSGLEPVDELGMSRMQAIADDSTGRFVAAVAKARGIEAAVIREMNAEMYSMAAAKSRGLVDGVESLEATIARAAKLARKRKRDMDQKAELRALAGLPADASDEDIEKALPATRAAATLGREVLRETGATSADQALLKVTAGAVALREVGELRASEKERAAADQLRVRTDRLRRAVKEGIPRSALFDVGEENGREMITPKRAWLRGSDEDLEEQLAALKPVGLVPRPRQAPDANDTAGIAERARAAGMTPEQYRESEARVTRGMKET